MNLAIQSFGVGKKSRKRSPHTVFHSAYRKDIGQEYLKFYNFFISYSF